MEGGTPLRGGGGGGGNTPLWGGGGGAPFREEKTPPWGEGGGIPVFSPSISNSELQYMEGNNPLPVIDKAVS